MDNFQKKLTQQILNFRDSRNWKQFHNGKDIAMCLSVEANEVLELFLWKNEEEVNRANLSDELADVLYSVLLLADHYDIDLEEAFLGKMKKNELKYPVETSFDSNKKYNEDYE